jgi:signal transduction histidine kinase
MSARARPEPVFFWQGLLILLPVGVMAAIGLTAILRDRAAVEHQARQQAQEILEQLAPELARRFLVELAAFDLSARDWFDYERLRLAGGRARTSQERVSARLKESELNGAAFRDWQALYPDLRLEEIFPDRVLPAADRSLTLAPGYDQPPRPPEWFLALTGEQRRSWDALRQAELSGVKAGGLEAAVKGFLELNPAVEARANAELIGLEHEPGHDPVQALRSFAQGHRGMMSESGLPLSNLALAEALRQAGSGPELGTVLEGLVDESLAGQSLLLPELLNQARALIGKAPQSQELLERAEKLWSAQARLGRIAWGVAQHGWPQAATNFWVEALGRRWFCVLALRGAAANPAPNPNPAPTPNPNPSPPDAAPLSSAAGGGAPGAPKGVAELRVYPKAVLERAFVRAIRATRVAVPGHFSLTAELEGEPLDLSGFRAARPGPARALAQVQDHLALSSLVLPVEPMPGETSSLGRLSRAIEPMASPPRWVLQLCLADPARLFAQQRQRTLLFGGLIVTSTLAAIFGLAAARGAFYRQLRLGVLKSNFVSSVSHELRSPIASVRLMAESLESGRIAEPAKQQEYFRFIGQECRRLSSLIENVLDFSRIEQGRKQYEFEPTDLVALTRQTLKLMEISATERQVNLALAIPEPDIEPLSTRPVVDGKAIQQALVNLIDNAMKHSPKGQTVTVGLEVSGMKEEGRRKQEEGRRAEVHPFSVLLWVEDRGDGIPKEDHEKIFERFYRRGSELRRQTQGVGIGLSIVKHIVAAHGGQVLVRSAAGQGSRFTIQLPGWNPGTREPAAELTAKNAKNAKTREQ